MDVLPFDRVYVIALPDRLDGVLAALGKAAIRPEVFRAIPKDALDTRALVELGYVTDRAISHLHTGRIACHLSHVAVLRRFLASDDATCLIFEDDLKPAPVDAAAKAARLVDSVPADWDILYLGRCDDDCRRDVAVAPGLVRCFSPACRHAYAVTRAGAHVLVANAFPMDRVCGDKIYKALIRDGRLTAYCAKPALFHQDRENLGSTIENFALVRECSCHGARDAVVAVAAAAVAVFAVFWLGPWAASRRRPRRRR